ncbi:type IV pilus assembly protein PilE [Litorivivens lipolytica]|uniref:Type IV pilus assembly protein PilE n=1 Tax=Litorivivens lipolytica TaxID=1524264 RepID=A0A7W4W549_9GAMM|nr:type IV pilus assembly protein PilE [Litorivivens lipolytica]
MTLAFLASILPNDKFLWLKTMHGLRTEKGFTLIEVMVVVAMIAIIATIAMGSYRDSTVRANRTAAASYLLEVANMQERYLLDNRSYAADMATLGASVPPEVSANYTVTTVGAAATYQVTATPTGAQASDDTDCGWLRINNTGAKSTQHGGTRCWR